MGSIWDGVDRDLLPLDKQNEIEGLPTVDNSHGRKDKKMQRTLSNILTSRKNEIPFSSDKIEEKYISNVSTDEGYRL